MGPHQIYLIPGFLGFANLGRFTYFGHVRRILAERFATLGLNARIHVVRPLPTASLPSRAAWVAEAIAATAKGGRGPIHLIGHSSGGLDARLLTAPGVALPTALDTERLAARVQTVVTVSTPHHGTPLASFFTTLQGQRLLQLLSLNTVYVLSFGHLPLSALLWMGSLVVRFGDRISNREFLDKLFGRLLEDFTVERRRAMRTLLSEVVRDQALMLQLTSEAMEVFNASVLERPGVRYGSVVTQSARPSLTSRFAVGLDPAGQVTHTLYGVLHRSIASMAPRKSPQLASQQIRAMLRAYGGKPPVGAHDGIVPTLSQAWGHIVYVALADHLDVLGHFGDATRDPPHADWLATVSGFDYPQFEALWSDVARFLVGKPPKQARGRAGTRGRARNRQGRAKARRSRDR